MSEYKSEDVIISTITSLDGNEKILSHSVDVPASEIVSATTNAISAVIIPEYQEYITETVERSNGLLSGVLEIEFKLPDKFGGFSLSFKRKPQKESKTIKRTVYKKP